MAVSGDVTVGQDGGNAKLHPYLVALVRWCMSSVWSTATVLLHRLLTASLQPIAASRSSKSRPAGKEHLDPEPRVECVVLHHPAVHNLDVIFVHGLYGSLGNTWRQGEWSSKYKNGPEKVHLKTTTSLSINNACQKCTEIHTNDFNDNEKSKEADEFSDYEGADDVFGDIDEEFYEDINRILPNEEVFITEQFYNNTLLDQVEIVDNYEAQAKFVSDLFKNNCNDCDNQNINKDDQNNFNDPKGVFNDNENRFKDSGDGYNVGNVYNDNGNRFNDVRTLVNDEEYACKCNDSGKVEIDIKEIDCKCKENEAKDCEMGCGCICDECYSLCWPKDWIKVDYPDARVISINYTSDPYLWRPLWIKESKRLRLHERAEQMTQQLLDLEVGKRPVIWVGHSKGGLFIKQIYCEAYEAYVKITNNEEQPKYQAEEQNMTEYRNDNEINNFNDNMNNLMQNVINDTDYNEDPTQLVVEENVCNIVSRIEESLSSNSEDKYDDSSRASLWVNSAGFMFYSVPHRGSPLADIKTPLTARSVELIEITKDCSLVLGLQARWLRAAGPARPLVRSLVETRRTLMSILWLRIVSADSADPGIGALCGVSVDHREICKPSSRQCLLYTELSSLIRAAVNKCRCQ